MYHGERIHEEKAIEKLKGLGYEHLIGKNFERTSSSEVILRPILRQALENINPHLTNFNEISALFDLKEYENERFIDFLKNGIPVSNYQKGETYYSKMKLVDWDNVQNNIFQVVNQLTITGSNNTQRRPDLILYVNGIPLVVFELKTPAKNKAELMVQAFEQLEEYKKSIPQLFTYNAFCVIDDGIQSRIGTTTSDFSRFVPWSSLDGINRISSNLDTIINGICEPSRILDVIKDFLFYTNDSKHPVKILAAWHQYFAVKTALPATKKAINGDRRIGVLWHTQGSGKSFTMVMYSALLARYLGNPTIIILTDRNDLDEQLYTTFSQSQNHLNNSIYQVKSASDLREKLANHHGGIVFSTLQKFTGEERSLIEVLSEREDIVVIADEAHRSHYGSGLQLSLDDDLEVKESYSFARQVRTALPNASFIGFTGTPVEETDKSTRNVFGDNLHVYGLAKAVEDGMTVSISYKNAIARLKLHNHLLAEIDELYQTALNNGAPEDNINKSKREFSRLRVLYEQEDRLKLIAQDIVENFDTRPQQELKGMIVCSSRQAASILFDQILTIKPDWKDNLKVVMTSNEEDSLELQRFKTSRIERDKLATDFKDPKNPFNLVIVVDMWLTGFDVPCLGYMYLDKELEKHNLMQTIARVNRVYPNKTSGLILDYRGIFSKLQEALRIYSDSDREYFNSYEDVLNQLKTFLEKMRDFFFGVLDLNDFLDKDKRLGAFVTALDYLQGLSLQADEKYIYYKNLSRKINSCFKICYNEIHKNNPDEEVIVAFLQELSRKINKLNQSSEYSIISLNKSVESLLLKTIEATDLEDILSLVNQSSTIDLLDPTTLNKIMAIPQKNVAIKIMEKILDDHISVTRKTNFSLSKKYSEMLQTIMRQYENKSLTSLEVLQGTLDLAQEIVYDQDNYRKLGLTSEEYAFYCAIYDKKVEDILSTDVLKDLCHKLVEQVRNSKSIDWKLKGSVRARMQLAIKKLLREYNYPPDGVEDATDKIIKEAEEQEISY
ncbi:MAG: type I restriction endonuclease subunit R [Brevinema sp.]